MAVRATDNTFRNFLRDQFPRRAIANHARDIRSLVAEVVKVEESDVVLAAVDASLEICWGERRDLNSRPPGPQPGALTD